MALLSESKPRKCSPTYYRCFGDAALARLFAQVVSTGIRSGNDLELFLEKHARKEGCLISDIDAFIADVPAEADRWFLATKDAVKASSLSDPDGHEVDFLLVHVVDGSCVCFLLDEQKAGFVFDTKKSDGELATLREAGTNLEAALAKAGLGDADTGYVLSSFGTEDKTDIVRGTKGRFDAENVETGRAVCDRLDLDYEDLLEDQRKDAEENMRHFASLVLETGLRDIWLEKLVAGGYAEKEANRILDTLR